MISDRFHQALVEAEITGWSDYKVEIEGSEDRQYHGFIVDGKAGPILNLDALNNFEADRTKFDLKSWDGSDIFNLKGTLIVACTERVANIIRKFKFTNVELEEL